MNPGGRGEGKRDSGGRNGKDKANSKVSGLISVAESCNRKEEQGRQILD